MSTRADQVQAEFPPGVVMPEELRELCDFLDASGYPISGYMRLGPLGDALKFWFGDGSEAWRSLAGFGSGPEGSILALWLYAGPDATVAPVVHLGSEGERLFVLADCFRDFLALFGIGYGELGFEDLELPPEEPESAERLRHWLEAKYGIIAPKTGIEISRRALSRHPNFQEWVEAAINLRDS